MSTKYKLCTVVLAGVCFTLAFFTFNVRSAEKPKSAREQILQAVEEAKKGNRQELAIINNSIGRTKGISVSKELLPEFVSYLKDKDAQVQLLGARALYGIRSPEGTRALLIYLKGKDLRSLRKKVEQKQIDDIQYVYEIEASVAAIMALGESGDKSAIPLLESLQGIRGLGTEMMGNPVERALAQLGAYKSLLHIPPDADREKIMNASTVVRKIRDPNKIPELIATSKDTKIADGIRGAAIDALAEINPPRITNLYMDIISDPNNSKALRCVTAMAAGKTKDDSIEKHLLIYVNDSKSDIRPYAFIGLVAGMPEVYLDQWFEKIMDPDEDLEFRKRIVGIRYVPYSLLRSRRTQIYKCLNASDEEGRPIDEIRVRVWRMINELFNEEAMVTLTTRDSGITASMQYVIDSRIRRKNYRLRFAERQKMIEEEIKRIVKVYNESPNGGEEK